MSPAATMKAAASSSRRSAFRLLAGRRLSSAAAIGCRTRGAMASPELCPVPKVPSLLRASSSSVFGIIGPSFQRAYRREPLPSPSELDLEEQVAKIDMDPNKMMQKGDPNSHQAIVRDVMPVGYFVTLPSGREGYLPAQDLGFTGGLAILQRLFKEGQEITVRIVCRGGAGREIVSVKKPEFAPPSEQKTIESMRLHFENEKKNAMRPRRR